MRVSTVLLGCLLASVGFGEWAGGQFMPADRVIANFEKRLQEEPDSAVVHYLLGRAHSYAYAFPAEEIDITYNGFPPYRDLKVGASHDKKEEHLNHLIQSIENYRKAVRLDPEDKLARLGLAWMYEQASDIAAKISKIEGLTSRPQTRTWWYEKALTTYRSLHNEFRQEEFDGPDRMYDLANAFPSMEAAQRIKIIVEVKGFGKFQRGEKAKISETVRNLEKKRRGITPIVVPLGSDDPSMLVDWGSSVSFDLLGDGVTQKQGWVTPQAGLLCWDPKGEGAITSGRQLFGTGTFWMFFANGFEAMSSLDDDGDGWLRGSELDGVCLWHDSDSDGKSDVREVRPVSEWGILALRCRGYSSGSIGLEVEKGVVWRDGRVTKLYDWITR